MHACDWLGLINSPHIVGTPAAYGHKGFGLGLRLSLLVYKNLCVQVTMLWCSASLSLSFCVSYALFLVWASESICMNEFFFMQKNETQLSCSACVQVTSVKKRDLEAIAVLPVLKFDVVCLLFVLSAIVSFIMFIYVCLHLFISGFAFSLCLFFFFV